MSARTISIIIIGFFVGFVFSIMLAWSGGLILIQGVELSTALSKAFSTGLASAFFAWLLLT